MGRQSQTAEKNPSIAEATTAVRSPGEHRNVFNRYYHLFSKGELYELTMTAVQELGLAVGSESDVSADLGVEIVQCGWERSNYYIEIRRWQR